ncbi:hypothetical protein CC2G_013947 [Coprinopsis cinerea AmutBmut pab1-1]|nr:hypothetical protein CC2G_013947 [Coprinopsis cinerea AmutBmut pab1-1]
MSDPRVKPRLPKSYTEQQLAFLKSHLPEFERRSHGSVRGDAKKYALVQAQKFIDTYGLPHEFHTLEEGDSRFKEQIYNWFKNTVGRNRRKAEGKPRSVKKQSIEQAIIDKSGDSSTSLSPTVAWTSIQAQVTPQPTQQQASLTGYTTQHVDHATHPSTSSSPVMTASSQQQQQQQHQQQPISIGQQLGYGGMVQGPSMASHSNTPGPTPQQPQQQQTQPGTHAHPISTHAVSMAPMNLTQNITQDTLRDAFLSPNLDPSILAQMIQSFVLSNPSHTPLTPVVEALFGATLSENPHTLVSRFQEASRYFPPSLVHAGACGSLAASRALFTQIRKNSVWVPVASLLGTSTGGGSGLVSPHGYGRGAAGVGVGVGVGVGPASTSSSLTEDMQRIAVERQRRKDHIHWARIHAAALESGMIGLGREGGPDSTGAYTYTSARVFSEMVARDAVWEDDEAEWVAGIFVLRAVIRTAIRGDRRQRDEYAEMLRVYEGRWKEIKDEVRQTMATEVLVSAKEELDRLDEALNS